MPLKFTQAIEEAGALVDRDTMLKWLQENAPEIAAIVEKDIGKNLTVGDVHATTALGNEKGSKPLSVLTGKPTTFREVDSEGEDDPDAEDNQRRKEKTRSTLKRVFDPAIDTFDTHGSSTEAFDHWISQVLDGPVDKRTKILRVVRHGATHLNNQDTSVDRIRGWSDVPLSEEGRKEAGKLAQKMAKDPPDHLVTSDLHRAHDTAKLIASACNMKIDDVSKGFRPWNVGDYAGKTSKEAVPVLCKYAVETPDKAVPGGESFNDFRSRFFKALSAAVDKYPGTLAVVTHHRGERLLSAWEKAGYPPDGSIDGKEFTKKGEGTAGSEDVEIPVERLRSAAAAKVTKWVNADLDFSKLFEEDRVEVVTYLPRDHVWYDGEGNAHESEWSTPFVLTKADAEERKVYGWASVVAEKGQLIVDKQDDVIMPDDLRKAAEEFVLYSRAQGEMHERKGVGRLIMSFVTTPELCDAFGVIVKDQRIGWMVGFQVDDDGVWKAIKSGALPEFSIGGKGERRDM